MSTFTPKWTPGPWKAELHRHYVNVLAPNGGLVTAISKETNDDTEYLPTALLISAAPDLFSACRAAVEELNTKYRGHGDSRTVEVIDQLYAAMAKAEGKNGGADGKA